MAEPLKNRYGPAIPRAIANMVHAVHHVFPKKQFLRDALVLLCHKSSFGRTLPQQGH